MFSKNQKRKQGSQSGDLFSAFASSAKTKIQVTTTTVVKPKPVVPRSAPSTPQNATPLSSSRPSSAASSSSRPLHTSKGSSAQKRKRPATPLSDDDIISDVKKPRRSKLESSDRSRFSSPARPRSSLGRPSTPAFGSLEKPIPRSNIVIDEDGAVPHVSSEDVVVRIISEAASGKRGKKGYVAYFRNPANPEDKSFEPSSSPPVVELEYPNHGASERFVLLFPVDRDDYQPIRELMRTIDTIAENYLTPTQRIPIGSLSTNASALSFLTTPTSTSTPPRSSPLPSSSRLTPSAVSRSMSPAASTPEPAPPPSEPLLRTLEKAYNTRNGPLFVKTVEAISAYFKEMRDEMLVNARASFNAPNITDVTNGEESAEGNAGTPTPGQQLQQRGGVPVKLWNVIMEEVYQRSVGPDVEETKKYKSFSSETYGELNPIFVSDLAHRFGLGPGKTFVDLGCGVGNCVLQAALQTGCAAYGIELNPPVAALSFVQQREFAARLRMWGLRAGPVTLREGDITESAEVSKWIDQADVVLCNNYIFSSDLNDALTWRFLDLRPGAKVVVLKPFWPLNRPLTERTAHGPEAVLSAGVEQMEYFTGSVSWTNEPGEFFVYTKRESRADSETRGRSASRTRTPQR